MNRHLSNVKEFHETFSMNIEQYPVIPSKERITLRLSLILEELTELAQASGIEALVILRNMMQNKVDKINNSEIKAVSIEGNIVDVIDALCDIDYVLNGTVLEYGLHNLFDLSCEEVHRSNMSKLCKTKEEAQETINFRKEHHNEDCRMILASDNERYIVLRNSDNKVMKSIRYSEANLKQFFK